MADILLATLNAKFIHAAFGLRYLLANLGPLQARAKILEFDLQQRPIDIAEKLLRENPAIIGLGVYIWNIAPTTELVTLIKRLAPQVQIVLGGPEVSYETDQQNIVAAADYVITGEADLQFAHLCQTLLSGQKPSAKIIAAPIPALEQLQLPYHLYNERDIAHRIIYVEASRGCPFTCEFCLSSLDIPVRQFPLEPFLAQLQHLLDQGVRQFKFVDRTFNLNLNVSQRILQFFLDRYHPGLFVHFEMIPDRLPEPLRALIAQFPPGALQFEVGIQTFNDDVAQRIKRRQDYRRLADNFKFLHSQTGVYIHADLIAGLPGESIDSFAAGFDQLIALQPDEIQVGILKRLRGTPIVHHDQEWEMIYSPFPPYEILQTKSMDFETIQRLRRFSRHWDLIGNSGNFVETTPLLWSSPAQSPFYSFLNFSEWLFEHAGRSSGIALVQLAELLFRFLTQQRQLPLQAVAQNLWRDYQRGGRSDKPIFLRPYLPSEPPAAAPRINTLKRQARHLAGPDRTSIQSSTAEVLPRAAARSETER